MGRGNQSFQLHYPIGSWTDGDRQHPEETLCYSLSEWNSLGDGTWLAEAGHWGHSEGYQPASGSDFRLLPACCPRTISHCTSGSQPA